ncbi:HNH endonuclease [Saccharopolyspora pogona]|uniref:HNH endonuclease n=1 Tax=Saccharopolyspora pogona TaxID=333966 RepID=UPI001685771A|nr:HNH endonuclease [Saccharopolyspora pogona]
MAVRETEPTERTKRLLFGSATHGGFSSCPEPLIYQYDGLLKINVDVAHIRSGRDDGPRYVEGYDRVRELENLLLLCRKHHRLVDDHPDDF